MFFLRKKQKEMKVSWTPREEGVECTFFLTDGKNQEPLDVPLLKEQIEQVYRLPGFMNYIGWEEMYEAGIIERNILPYRKYYHL